MHIGLTYDETMCLPLGDLLTLIAIEQIKVEGAHEKNDEDFWSLMERE